MKAYLIDPEKEEVTEVEYSGDYKDIYRLIDCSTFDIVGITPEGDGIYIDDEGLYAEKKYLWSFKGILHKNHLFNLVNKGLVLGSNIVGDSIEPDLSLKEVQRRVVWHW